MVAKPPLCKSKKLHKKNISATIKSNLFIVSVGRTMLTATATPSNFKDDRLPANNLVCVLTPISSDLITRSVSTEDDKVFIKNKWQANTQKRAL